MKRLTLSALPLLAFAGALAGCSERSTPTSARARPLAATAALVDRPYAWSVTCHGRSILFANWSWTENGVAIASGSAICGADQTLSGSGVRAANANGFTAQVGTNSNGWTFDPAGPFKASLSGSEGGHCFTCWSKERGKLTVDS